MAEFPLTNTAQEVDDAIQAVVDAPNNSITSGSVELVTSGTIHTHVSTQVAGSSTDGYTPSSYTGQESVTLPNGLIMKWGSLSMTSSSTSTVTFASPFSTIVNAQVSWQVDNTSATNPVRLQGPITNSTLEIRNLTGHTVTVYWQAVGY